MPTVSPKKNIIQPFHELIGDLINITIPDDSGKHPRLGIIEKIWP